MMENELNLLQGLNKVSVSGDLFKRIQQKIIDKKSHEFSARKILAIAACLVLIICANMYGIFYKNNVNSTNHSNADSAEALVSAMNLAVENDFYNEQN